MGYQIDRDIADEYYEPTWRLFSETYHTARTPKAISGGGQISPGERYSKTVGLEDGVFTVHYAHVFDKVRYDAAMAAGWTKQAAQR